MACRNWRQAYCQKLSCDPLSTSSPSHTSWKQGLRVRYEDKAGPGAAAQTGQDLKLNGLNLYGSLPTQDIFCDLQYISSDAQVIIITWNLDSKFSFLNFNVGALMYAPMHTNITGFEFKKFLLPQTLLILSVTMLDLVLQPLPHSRTWAKTGSV